MQIGLMIKTLAIEKVKRELLLTALVYCLSRNIYNQDAD
jgi:hypothetical protein